MTLVEERAAKSIGSRRVWCLTHVEGVGDTIRYGVMCPITFVHGEGLPADDAVDVAAPWLGLSPQCAYDIISAADQQYDVHDAGRWRRQQRLRAQLLEACGLI